MGELKPGKSLDSKTEQEFRDKATGEFRNPRLASFPFDVTQCRLLDLEAIKIQDADGAPAPEQAHGHGCSRGC